MALTIAGDDRARRPHRSGRSAWQLSATSSSPSARNKVLRGVDLDVPAGRTRLRHRPVGSGKSTLLRAINRLLEPDAR